MGLEVYGNVLLHNRASGIRITDNVENRFENNLVVPRPRPWQLLKWIKVWRLVRKWEQGNHS